jgi:hypothetical protein
MSKGRDRVICVPLSEAEWAAFIARIPEPVEWLRKQILSQVEGAQALPPPQRLVRPDRSWSTSRV